jgi:hypothetical protein
VPRAGAPASGSTPRYEVPAQMRLGLGRRDNCHALQEFHNPTDRWPCRSTSRIWRVTREPSRTACWSCRTRPVDRRLRGVRKASAAQPLRSRSRDLAEDFHGEGTVLPRLTRTLATLWLALTWASSSSASPPAGIVRALTRARSCARNHERRAGVVRPRRGTVLSRLPETSRIGR